MSKTDSTSSHFELTLGNTHQVAIIDAADAPLVAGFKWYLATRGNAICYVRANVQGQSGQTPITLHRLVMNAAKGEIVDHKNGNVLDNRRDNLRICSHAQNMQNSKLRTNSKSGIRNVAFEARGRRGARAWRVTIRCFGKVYKKWFGSTDAGKLAAERWAAAKRIELHGEFAIDAR